MRTSRVEREVLEIFYHSCVSKHWMSFFFFFLLFKDMQVEFCWGWFRERWGTGPFFCDLNRGERARDYAFVNMLCHFDYW